MGGGLFLYMLICFFSWVDIRVYNIKKSRSVFKVSFFSFLYCLHGLMFLLFPTQSYAYIAGPIWGILGTLNYAFYFKMMSEYFDLENEKITKAVNYVLYSGALFIAMGLGQYLLTGESFLIGKVYAPKSLYFQYTGLMWQPGQAYMIVLMVVSNFIIGSTIYLAMKALVQDKIDRILLLGISLSIIFPIHDILVYIFDFKYGIALASFTYIVELGRVSYRYHKQALSQNQFLKTELENASSLANVSYIAGSINHDLNNSLMQISIAGSVLESNYSEQMSKDEKFSNLVRRINNSSSRITKLSTNYLRLLRGGEVSEIEKVDINEVLDSLGDMYRDKCIQENVSMDIVGCAENTILQTNRVLLEQVMMNLINNSLDALRGIESSKIDIQVKRLGENFEVKIKDNGPGIPKEIQRNIFDMGFTTKKGKGTGIGLWVAKGVTEKLDGNLSLESGSSGTTFVVSVPL